MCQLFFFSKVHLVLHHLADYIDLEGTSMGIFSEQAGETLHSDFAQTWLHYQVKNPGKSSYGKNLLDAVVHYNGSHV